MCDRSNAQNENWATLTDTNKFNCCNHIVYVSVSRVEMNLSLNTISYNTAINVQIVVLIFYHD
jgi:hypothetical protein